MPTSVSSSGPGTPSSRNKYACQPDHEERGVHLGLRRLDGACHGCAIQAITRRGIAILSAIDSTQTVSDPASRSARWSAVGSMAMCVFLLIAAEFMPVSLLTPIAHDLNSTVGMAGQAISISGLFAVITSLYIATFAARYDRRHVLVGLTAMMLASLILIAVAPNFPVLMLARAILGIVIGGFWSLATATVMQLVSEDAVPKAVGSIYVGSALATAFAAPIGSYFGGIIGWRGVFWTMVPLGAVTIVWQWMSLPSIPAQTPKSVRNLFALLKRRHVAFAIIGAMLSFAGAYTTFTYLRPFLENRTHVSVTQLSLLLLSLGSAGFLGTSVGTALTKRHLYLSLGLLQVVLATLTGLLLLVQRHLWPVAFVLFAWGATNSAIPVCWSTWLSQGIRDEPESGGGLLVAAVQLSIMSGGALGGLLLDRISITATFVAGCLLLLLSAAVVGNGHRLHPQQQT